MRENMKKVVATKNDAGIVFPVETKRVELDRSPWTRGRARTPQNRMHIIHFKGPTSIRDYSKMSDTHGFQIGARQTLSSSSDRALRRRVPVETRVGCLGAHRVVDRWQAWPWNRWQKDMGRHGIPIFAWRYCESALYR